MEFYHFTAVSMAEAILSKGHLTRPRETRRREHQRFGCLADNGRCADGHGVLTGQEKMTARNMAYLTRVQGSAPKNSVMFNKTRIRITVEMDADAADSLPCDPVAATGLFDELSGEKSQNRRAICPPAPFVKTGTRPSHLPAEDERLAYGSAGCRLRWW